MDVPPWNVQWHRVKIGYDRCFKWLKTLGKVSYIGYSFIIWNYYSLFVWTCAQHGVTTDIQCKCRHDTRITFKHRLGFFHLSLNSFFIIYVHFSCIVKDAKHYCSFHIRLSKAFWWLIFLLLVISSWNFRDVCIRFLYNQKRNFSLIRLKMRNFPIDPYYKNCPHL